MDMHRTVPTRPLAGSKITKGNHIMMLTIIPILLATVLGVAGQLLLKQGMSQMGALELSLSAVPSILWRMATSPYVVGGLLVYVSGTFFWLITLNRVQLSFAYPFISLGIVLGTLAAWGLFRENIPPLRWIGLFVVCVGVIMVSRT